MKKTIIIALLTLIAFTSQAQEACPEFANMVSAIDQNGGTSKDLAMEKAIAKQQKKGLYRGWDNSIRLEGPTAKVSVNSGQSFSFKPLNPNVHPSQQIKLYPFNTEKQFRDLTVGGTNMFGGSKSKNADDDSIELTFEKISDGCYKIIPGVILPAGQYAFSLGSNSDVQGTNAGWGSSTSGQTWFGFSVK